MNPQSTMDKIIQIEIKLILLKWQLLQASVVLVVLNCV
jgi:hypothetical protein